MAALQPRRTAYSTLAVPHIMGRGWPEWFFRDLDEWIGASEAFPADAQLKVEEYIEDDQLVIRAEMPGIDPTKDVELTVHDSTLRIRATREQTSETRDRDGYRSEFSYGSFTRVMPLPAGASEADVVAHYDDGILEIRVPIRTEQAAARKVPIGRRSEPTAE